MSSRRTCFGSGPQYPHSDDSLAGVLVFGESRLLLLGPAAQGLLDISAGLLVPSWLLSARRAKVSRTVSAFPRPAHDDLTTPTRTAICLSSLSRPLMLAEDLDLV